MVHVAVGSSVKGSPQASWSSGPYVKGGFHSQQQENRNKWAGAKLEQGGLVNNTTLVCDA